MARYEITAPDGQRFEINAPDDATQEQVLSYAQSQFAQQAAQPLNMDVPSHEQDAFVAQGYAQNQPRQQPSIADRAIAGGEAALAIGTGATTGTLGMIAGTLQQGGREILAGEFGTPEAANRIEQRAADVSASATYAPRSELGQRYMQNIGDAAAPFAGSAGLTAQMNIAGNAARAVIPAARTAAIQGAKTASETVKQELGLLSSTNYPKQLETIKKIKEGSTENELAPYRIEPKRKPVDGIELRATDYKLAPDDAAKKAMDNDWEAGTVQAVKNFDPKTAQVAARMLRVAQMGTKDDTFKANNRPLAEIGDEFAQQVYQVKRAKKQAGHAINEAAASLKGERVDVTPAVDKFIGELEDGIGIKLIPSKNGVRVDFRGSDLEGKSTEFRAAQSVIENLVSRMYNTKTPSAYDVHRLKQFIDSQSSYGSTLGGMKGNANRIIKGLRHDLDTVLDDNFELYRVANQDYAQTKSALDAVQELVGKKIDLDADYSPQALGRLSRRVLSNAQSAERVREALINIDEVAMQYGSESAGKLTDLVKFADTLDKQFGIASDTSLAGDIAKGTAQAMRQSKVDTALNMAGSAYQKLKGVNVDSKYKTMNELLNRQRGAKNGGTELIKAPGEGKK